MFSFITLLARSMRLSRFFTVGIRRFPWSFGNFIKLLSLLGIFNLTLTIIVLGGFFLFDSIVNNSDNLPLISGWISGKNNSSVESSSIQYALILLLGLSSWLMIFSMNHASDIVALYEHLNPADFVGWMTFILGFLDTSVVYPWKQFLGIILHLDLNAMNSSIIFREITQFSLTVHSHVLSGILGVQNFIVGLGSSFFLYTSTVIERVLPFPHFVSSPIADALTGSLFTGFLIWIIKTLIFF